MSRQLIAAVDRSWSKGVAVYCLVASDIRGQRELANLRSKFTSIKHVDKFKRSIYFSARIKVINKLVDQNNLIKLVVSTHYHTIERTIKKIEDQIKILVVDDYIYNPISKLIEAEEVKVVPEGKIKYLKVSGISKKALETLILIADNIANYVRLQLISGRKLSEILTKLPLKT